MRKVLPTRPDGNGVRSRRLAGDSYATSSYERASSDEDSIAETSSSRTKIDGKTSLDAPTDQFHVSPWSTVTPRLKSVVVWHAMLNSSKGKANFTHLKALVDYNLGQDYILQKTIDARPSVFSRVYEYARDSTTSQRMSVQLPKHGTFEMVGVISIRFLGRKGLPLQGNTAFVVIDREERPGEALEWEVIFGSRSWRPRPRVTRDSASDSSTEDEKITDDTSRIVQEADAKYYSMTSKEPVE